VTLISCDKENENDDEFIYPLTAGNSWDYSREWNLYFYPDSTVEDPVYEDTLTISADVSVTITGEVSLNDTLDVVEFRTSETVHGETEPFIGLQYYNNNKDGLYIYAYKSVGSIILPKIRQAQSIVFKGMNFEDFHHLSNFVQQLTPNTRVISDSLQYENPPVKSLQYPLEIDAQWIFREDNNLWRIGKKVIDRKNVELDIGTFDCYEVKWLYDLDQDEIWDEDIWITDLISTKGLIQRKVSVLRIEEATINGATGRLVDGVDVYSLTGLSVE
jgi:hypothetical protein